MLTSEIKDLLRQLRQNQLDVAQAAFLDQISFDELVSDLRDTYPIVFLERTIGQKHEVAMAKSLGCEHGLRKVSGSDFPSAYVSCILRNCVLLSAYQSSISEITVASSIRLQPAAGQNGALLLRMNRCFKLDHAPDGWRIKAVSQRPATLSKKLLESRGWKFRVFFPLALQARSASE